MYVRVHVAPGSKREQITEGKGGILLITVREPAEGNQANKRVRELVALRLLLPLSKVRILSGHHSPTKLLTIDN
ncbi:MAG: DUF167 domain-containing protein [Patescibacteria group bacterium]